ncbi:hypothetical protein SKAU_G00043850 [Synaphobranchus kaupii]|uniref:Uncharacterized protein n=1 Tax=Synaphobranchus kaupii TaxID=118154 RepID=A0A9Q1G2Y9_SYNKA|nr:hypothetical protein SKAU_G00043850 [Synaphobranchus kaupii]
MTLEIKSVSLKKWEADMYQLASKSGWVGLQGGDPLDLRRVLAGEPQACKRKGESERWAEAPNVREEDSSIGRGPRTDPANEHKLRSTKRHDFIKLITISG